MKILDCRDMQCPRPVLETRKQLLAHPDTPVRVRVANDIAQANVTRLAGKEGFSVEVSAAPGEIILELKPAQSQEPRPAKKIKNPTAKPSDNTVVYISSATMGTGSDALGEVLMRNFIFTLLEAAQLPSTILLVNSGAKLSCEGSSVLEPLQHLANAGVTINSCGLCLEFFELTDKLKVGQVSNMLETVEAMQQADHIIQP